MDYKEKKTAEGQRGYSCRQRKQELIAIEACLQDMRYLSKWKVCIFQPPDKMKDNKSWFSLLEVNQLLF